MIQQVTWSGAWREYAPQYGQWAKNITDAMQPIRRATATPSLTDDEVHGEPTAGRQKCTILEP
jgi:hypothetical protein